MRRTFSRLSIQYKLVVLFMAIAGFALVLSLLAHLLYNARQLRRDMQAELQTLAHSLGTNTASAIIFDDPSAAEKTMESLVHRHYVMSAHILTPDMRIFARYIRKGDDPAAGRLEQSRNMAATVETINRESARAW
jgi:hypothetical protein